MTTDVAARLDALESRLRRLEDEREILQLITAYGPLVDAGRADEVAALWTEDGVYDIDEVFLGDQEAIHAMVLSRGHQRWIAGGCSHFLGPAHVTVDGDEAVAVCESLMVTHGDDGFVVRRATANHWQLRRTPAGWRVTVRTSRVLDGRAESPALLAAGALGERP
ncbi:nuclear transport factor 2 family protein [Nocardioides sp. SOB77]|uniref:Nuclear transport factor 2 family protein n=1 Tax=Nocardioides oceani TaxID=3058369 RepID=A0ABT8FBW6_9ACTN|nr:nuclear transport factor 2 family protein [Nocardioides oceani]MDN4172186.1 nuclear transport factor 2 family protein [Nocardioides oceani]